MCQVHTGAYVSLLKPGKTDGYRGWSFRLGVLPDWLGIVLVFGRLSFVFQAVSKNFFSPGCSPYSHVCAIYGIRVTSCQGCTIKLCCVHESTGYFFTCNDSQTNHPPPPPPSPPRPPLLWSTCQKRETLLFWVGASIDVRRGLYTCTHEYRCTRNPWKPWARSEGCTRREREAGSWSAPCVRSWARRWTAGWGSAMRSSTFRCIQLVGTPIEERSVTSRNKPS